MTGRFDAIWRRGVKRALIAGGLEAAALAARAGVMPSARGCGAIFTLHHVRPRGDRPAEPNAHLDITPDFLDRAIRQLKADGYEFLSLCDVAARMKRPAGSAAAGQKPFAAFTLDDGYRDNIEHALPVFERHGVPFTIFVTKGFAERSHGMWWETLAALLNALPQIRFDFGDGEIVLPLATITDRLDAFDRFSRFVASGPESQQVAVIDALARRHGIDALAITAQLTMDVVELQRLAGHPLATLGAHTVSHRSLAQLDADEARREMQACLDWMETVFGQTPKSLAYPYGTSRAVSKRDKELARELGFDLAVTTRPGTLVDRFRERMTALPRISLNGYYQQPRYVSALASGLPFSLGAKPRMGRDKDLSPAGEVVG